MKFSLGRRLESNAVPCVLVNAAMPITLGPSRPSRATHAITPAVGWRPLGMGLLLIFLVALIYWASVQVPFQFDDEPAVVYNPTIRQLWPLGPVLQPPLDGAGVTGRPLVNLSLAINYAWGGLAVQGYHVMNLLLHGLTSLTLWGILRRTLRRPAVPIFYREHAESLAGSSALLWSVHPLLSESVICVVQRNEIMGGLFYLLTLYGFIRSATSAENAGGSERGAAIFWAGVAVTSCLLGMASKEIMATAPFIVLLYDRTFVAGSFAAALRGRARFYLWLAATWLLLAWLMLGNNQRAGAVGFGLGVSGWDYLLTQCRALVIYLRLSLWPHPLVLDYGTDIVHSWREVWWQGLVVLTLLLGTLVALWRRPILGFLGAWFFVILAPSSSFIPLTTQTIAEHRMYLPLLAVIILGLALLNKIAGRYYVILVSLLALFLGGATYFRQQIYQSELSLWADTVVGAPNNQRAHLNLGQILYQRGRFSEAEQHFTTALRLKPAYAEAHYNLGLTNMKLDRRVEAIAQFEAALQLVPDYAVAHNDLAIALVQTGQIAAAQLHFEGALQARPDFAGAHFNLANLLLRLGQPAEAVIHYQAAREQSADVAEYHSNLAIALMQTGRPAEALTEYEAALHLAPTSPEIQLQLALALASLGRLREAVDHAAEAVKLRPDFLPASHYLSEMRADLIRTEAQAKR
ncbi:MAG: tetratricopeptide repeat protein [Opitutaceae bacterium]|nr:tetratricopeptide repeat protein [Opitutaceae bacterium]